MSDATWSGPPMSLDAELFHDLLCDELEAGWKTGSPPRIEDLLLRVEAAQRPELFAALLPVERDYRPAADDRARFPDYRAMIDELDAGDRADENEPPPLPTIPGYEITAVLGAGSMGIVFRARDLTDDREVAIKTLNATTWRGTLDHRRFLRESTAVSHVHHPGIVRQLAHGEADGLPYCVMELVEGGSLKDRLDGTPQDPTWATALVERIARSVHHLHECRVVHRDLKPANILLAGPADDPTPKVADFGLAKFFGGVEPTLTKGPAVLGTACYMAPEQARGDGKVGPPADVHALGAILYELVTGRPPYRAATYEATVQQVLWDDPLRPSERVPTLSPEIDAVCLRCLEKDPGKRYPSALELADDLQRIGGKQPPETPPIDDRDRHARRATRIGCEGLELIRRTPSASLYSAVRSAAGQKVLLKFAHGPVGSPAHAALQREARLLAEIDHPNVLRLLDYAEVQGQPCAVFEHVPDGRLLDEPPRRLTERRAAELTLMIALGLAEVHQHGIVHGSLNRESVLLGKNDAPKLTGFDFARRTADPPEAGADGPPTVAADIRALGRILGDLLRMAESTAHGSNELWAIPEACRSPDPALRPASAAEIAASLRAYLSPEGSSGNEATVGPSEECLPPGATNSYRLRIMSGPQRLGENFDLPRRRTRVGRHRDNDLVLRSSNVSKVHCDIIWNEALARHELIDTGSKNGTRVNEARVTVTRCLCDGDEIRLPDFVLRYEAVPPVE